MALLGNYSVLLKSPGSFRGGSTISDNRSNWNKTGSMRNIYLNYSGGFSKFNGIPIGYNPPYTWVIAQTDGGLGSINSITSTFTNSGDIVGGVNGTSDITSSFTITNADMSLIVSAVCSILSTFTTDATILGKFELASTLSFSGSVTASLNALGNAIASLNSSFSMNNTISATGTLSADISTLTTLSPENLAAALWNSLAASFNTAGTMGNKLNSAGAAADPWATLVPGSYGPGTAGEVLGNITPSTDPWSTVLPGSYNEGEAGYIIGNLLTNIPDEVWNELKTTHTTNDTYGKIIQDLYTLSKQIKALTAAQL